MGMDFRGDPSSALLEVLDPEQNASFNDHYLEVDYDLSNVMFVTTANTLNIPAPLMDRMEIIRIAGYTEDEKIEIARTHLIPASAKKHGLAKGEWSIKDEALHKLVRRYTREAGVRNLEREISNLARKSVKDIVIGKTKSVSVDEKVVEDYLGVPKFRYGMAEEADQVGAVTGLAWTEVGGELLTIEGVMMPGKGRMTVTGNLKDVMKESISAAASYVRSRAIDFGIEPIGTTTPEPALWNPAADMPVWTWSQLEDALSEIAQGRQVDGQIGQAAMDFLNRIPDSASGKVEDPEPPTPEGEDPEVASAAAAAPVPVPQTIIKPIDADLVKVAEGDYVTISIEDTRADTEVPPEQMEQYLQELEEKMREAARKFDFKQAAALRDRLKDLKSRALLESGPAEAAE
mgnify:CR=1 FL=1